MEVLKCFFIYFKYVLRMLKYKIAIIISQNVCKNVDTSSYIICMYLKFQKHIHATFGNIIRISLRKAISYYMYIISIKKTGGGGKYIHIILFNNTFYI